MASFWLSKKALLEALKLSEGAPQSTMIVFEGSSEIKNGVHYTITKIEVCGKKKTLRQNYTKMVEKNGCKL